MIILYLSRVRLWSLRQVVPLSSLVIDVLLQPIEWEGILKRSLSAHAIFIPGIITREEKATHLHREIEIHFSWLPVTVAYYFFVHIVYRSLKTWAKIDSMYPVVEKTGEKSPFSSMPSLFSSRILHYEKNLFIFPSYCKNICKKEWRFIFWSNLLLSPSEKSAVTKISFKIRTGVFCCIQTPPGQPCRSIENRLLHSWSCGVMRPKAEEKSRHMLLKRTRILYLRHGIFQIYLHRR